MVSITIHNRPVVARALVLAPPLTKNVPEVTSAACCYPTRHTAPQDGEASLFKMARGAGVFLNFMSDYVMVHRNGLVVACEVSQATGTSERKAALRMDGALRG
jgi:hypothetical protein